MTKRTKTKAANLKENVVPCKLKALPANKSQLVSNKIVKPLRRAFVDKTNSASDDNVSNETPQKLTCKAQNTQENLLDNEINNNKERPRRERRIPPRFKGYLSNVSIEKKDDVEAIDILSKSPLAKATAANSSREPLNKTPKHLDNVLSYSRPRRIFRLPSKFEDHDVSLFTSQHGSTKHNNTKNTQLTDKRVKCKSLAAVSPNNDVVQNIQSPSTSVKSSASVNDMSAHPSTLNETVKRKHNMIVSTPLNSEKLKEEQPNNINTKRLFDKNTSFRVLEFNRRMLNTSCENVDIYEFTYDPTEEPPQKKKKKRTVRRKPPTKQKTVIFKNNYDTNLSKALASLKNVVNKNTTPTSKQVNTDIVKNNNCQNPSTNINDLELNLSKSINSTQSNNIPVKDKFTKTYPDHDNINYSPVNSPNHSIQSLNVVNQNDDGNNIDQIQNDDPLNLQEDASFFDVPVASSSMNMSAKRQMASPWRVEFENLPIKWQVNTYVKPNMTPAVESSFINFNDSKKKHVYTNIGINCVNDTFDATDREAPKLQQPSIISFLKEVIERSAKKKERGVSITPTKANPVLETDSLNVDVNNVSKEPVTPEKVLDRELVTHEKDTYQSSSSSDELLSSIGDSQKHRIINIDQNKTPLNTSRRNSYFGFDVTDSPDKENVNDNITKKRLKALRPRARAVLQEFNQQRGPSRVVIPVSKSKFASNSEVVRKLYEGMKSATDAPAIPDIVVENFSESTNVDDALWQNVVESEDSQSVHLYEDIEVVHHLNPSRKSYGKEMKNQKLSKKEQSHRNCRLDTTKQKLSKKEQSHVSFAPETITQKLSKKEPFDKSYPKKTKKQKLSKKEQQEADAWAAGFNSMCEDIDEFDLVVE